MKVFTIILIALAALMIPTAALATHQEPPKPPPFAGTTFTINGACVTSTNILQDAFLKLAVKFKFKVSTDEVFGPLAPYGFADRDADDSYVTLGCVAAAAPQVSSAYMCPKIADTQTVPQLVAAADVVRSFAAGMYSPTAFPGATVAVNPKTGYNADSYPTVIGTAKTPYTLRCGFGYGGVWWTDYLGELANVKAFGNTTVGEYPIR